MITWNILGASKHWGLQARFPPGKQAILWKRRLLLQLGIRAFVRRTTLTKVIPESEGFH
jgi:hypothetical protein